MVVTQDCHSLMILVLIFTRFKDHSELFYMVGTMLTSHLYRCDIPTIATLDDTNATVRESVYVGLHATYHQH